jgi:tellurite resistance protein TerC
MGLRPMFFLLDGLLDRLVYLTYGLAAILGFIGVKLLLHALHESGFDVPEIGTFQSLVVIIGVLVVTVLASLWKIRNDPDAMTEHDLTGHHHEEGAALEELDQEARQDQPGKE